MRDDNEPGLDRRDLLGAVGTAAAVLAADHAFAAGAGGKVEDRTASIKIASLRGFVVGPKAYFKIETNHKVTGWAR